MEMNKNLIQNFSGQHLREYNEVWGLVLMVIISQYGRGMSGNGRYCGMALLSCCNVFHLLTDKKPNKINPPY